MMLGKQILIYPHGHLGENNLALCCNGSELTSAENAGNSEASSAWTIADAGDGCFYLKNELGYYWAYQDTLWYHSLTCTSDINSAVGISFTWDSKNKGICFLNNKDGKVLTNIHSYNSRYNWCSSPTDYDTDSKITFDVYIKGSGTNPFHVYTENGIKYVLNDNTKEADIRTIIERDVIIPQTVNYNGNVYKVGDYSLDLFKGCNSIDARYYNGAIEDAAFKYCLDLRSVTFGNVDNIGESAFKGCERLQSVTFGNVDNIGESAFKGCDRLRSVTFGDVKNIGKEAFYGLDWLFTTATFGCVDNIGESAFSGCSSLSNIKMSGVKSIGANAFSGCPIVYFSFPDVESVGEKAFNNCSSLTALKLDKVKTFGSSPFTGCTSLSYLSLSMLEPPAIDDLPSIKYILVPKESVEKYKNKSGWNTANVVPAGTAYLIAPTGKYQGFEVEKNRQKDIVLTANSNNLQWSSNNPNIVSLEQGRWSSLNLPKVIITGKEIGTAIITATDDENHVTTCEVKVLPVSVENVTLPESVLVERTATKKINAVVEPNDAANKTLEWVSDNPDIATVDQDGMLLG